MNIREVTNLTGAISIDISTDPAVQTLKDVAYANVNIDASTGSINLNITVQDPANLATNITIVQQQINDLMTNINAKLTSLGIPYTI